MYIPIKNKNQINVKNKSYLFVDSEDFKLKLKTLNNLIVYNSEEIILETPDDQENNSSSSGSAGGSSGGSENVEFDGGDAKFVYKIANAEYEDMNGYYYFDEYDSYALVYKNPETNAKILIGSDYIDIIDNKDNYITSGPLADTQIIIGEFYLNFDEGELSTIEMHRVNKFYKNNGTYCKLIVTSSGSFNGEYYPVEESKDLWGEGHEVYARGNGAYLVYQTINDNDLGIKNEGYTFITNFSNYEPYFLKSGEDVEGIYKHSDHPVADGYENLSPVVTFDK